MKSFLTFILAIFLLQGCFSSEESIPSFKFKFGDRVYVADGFYRGSKGRILACYYVNKQDGVRCELDATLVSTDGKYSVNERKMFSQNELVEDASDQ